MAQTLSQNFIGAMEGERDRLYTAALVKAGGSGAAEHLLEMRARKLFGDFARDGLLDVAGEMGKDLNESGAAAGELVAMPADVWARLAAAVQVEAARSANDKALNPDSVLLRPDPLLAPRKRSVKHEREGFDLTSPSRLMMVACAAVLVGVLATVYVMTRPSGRSGTGGGGGGGAMTAPATAGSEAAGR